MPIQGILNTARSLSFYTRKQEVVANNLANANSDAFKADRIMARAYPGATFPVPVQTIDLQQGTFRETSRTLDVALSGPGFLVVHTADGDRLTRGGSLQLDPAGRLTDSHGDLVMGTDGPLVLQGTKVEIQGDGTVLVDDSAVGRLQVVNPQDPGKLLKSGFGRYEARGALQPADAAVTHVRQGAIEEANLDPLLSMVDLVTIQRSYAANIEAMHALDGVLGSVTNDVPKE